MEMIHVRKVRNRLCTYVPLRLTEPATATGRMQGGILSCQDSYLNLRYASAVKADSAAN